MIRIGIYKLGTYSRRQRIDEEKLDSHPCAPGINRLGSL